MLERGLVGRLNDRERMLRDKDLPLCTGSTTIACGGRPCVLPARFGGLCLVHYRMSKGINYRGEKK